MGLLPVDLDVAMVGCVGHAAVTAVTRGYAGRVGEPSSRATRAAAGETAAAGVGKGWVG